MIFRNRHHLRGPSVSVQKRLSHGFQFGGSYTWSKATDDSSATIAGDSFSNSVTSWFWFAPKISHAPSDFNVTHSASINGIWQVPGSPRDGLAGAVLGGWEMGSIVKLNSGVPTTPLIGGDPLGVQNAGSDPFSIPDLIPGCDPVNHNFKSNPGGVFLGYINYQLLHVAQGDSGDRFAMRAVLRYAGNPFRGTCSNLLGNAGRNSIYRSAPVQPGFLAVQELRGEEDFGELQRAVPGGVFQHLESRQLRAARCPLMAPAMPRCSRQNGTPSGAGGLQSLVTLPRDIQFALKVIW